MSGKIVGRVELREHVPYLHDPEYASPWEEHTYVAGPGESHVFCGADPAWHPGREFSYHPGQNPAELMPERCPRCGSTDALDSGAVREGELTTCAQCSRWGRDPMLARRMFDEVLSRGTLDPSLRQNGITNDAASLHRTREALRSRPPLVLRRGPDGEMRPIP